MHRTRSAKIVATLGPSSSTKERLAEMFTAGADVFRLNFSHGSHADHRERFQIIRDLEKERGRPIGIMADLQGPKLRVGRFANGKATLVPGAPFRLDLDKTIGDSRRASLPHPEIFAALSPGMDLLLDDGKFRLRVMACHSLSVDTEVVIGGDLSDYKGVNVPTAVLDLSPLTDKDRRDLSYALDLGTDWVALSFVQRPEDVAEVRKLIGGRAGVLVKLEKPSAIERLDAIVELADAVMVARGDLGVELAPEDVPGIQKRIIRLCRETGKPVVVATQMLESMIRSPTPTRAEASDVATAVYDGADAVMLSAETAAGSYPVEAVAMMDRIISRVERDPLYRRILEAEPLRLEATAADAITMAARQCAKTVLATTIVTFTSTGSTTFRAARERPEVPILSLTPSVSTARRLAMVWGVHPVETEDLNSFGDMVSKGVEIAKREGFAEPGDRLVITAGVPFGTPGATNILRIAWAD
ncbi:MAG: pyruvate kinase [Rhodospirillales bacterium]|nr:pyruvate kinase [Rhodospirillales bacterium]